MKPGRSKRSNFDMFGNFIVDSDQKGIGANGVWSPQPKVLATVENLIPRATADEKFRIRMLESPIKRWKATGSDARFHIKALIGCVFCFSSIYFPSLLFYDRIERINARSKVDPAALDRGNFTQYIRKKYGIYYDISEHFQT